LYVDHENGPLKTLDQTKTDSTDSDQLTVSDFARLRLAFEPDPLQSAVLDSSARRAILNCTRQWGKSTVLAIKAAHRAYSIPGSLVLVASPSIRQSAEFLRKAAAFLSSLGIATTGDRPWRLL
jgi:hypothetical protein